MALGFVPEGASSYTFPMTMGRQHANRLLLAAEKITAREAYVSGLVTQVLEGRKEEFLGKVCEKAKAMGEYSAESLRMAKALIVKPTDLARQREQSVLEGHDLRVRVNSPEAQAMIKRFADNAGKGKSKL